MRLFSVLISASVIILSVLISQPLPAQTNLVVNPGFESGEPISGLPNDYGYWSFEPVDFVTAENGINPHGGSRMLRFLYTGPIPHSNTTACEIYQVIDISGASDIINSEVTLSAWYNRVAGNAQTDNVFCLNIYAFAGSESSFPTQINNQTYLADASGCVYTDSDPSTWEQASAMMTIPENTDFLGIRIVAGENVYNDGSDPEFDGHYGDDVVLQITPISAEESSWGAIKSLYK